MTRKSKSGGKARPDRIAVGYVRVSTEEQASDGVSLAAQEARLRAYAAATERELAEVIVDDGQSAKSLARPGMQRILSGIQSGQIGTVLALKLDRLTRSVRDLAHLVELCAKKDVALVLVTESIDTSTAIGRLLANLIGSVAQWEREAIGERTAFALAHKRRQGRAYSRTPFGYRRVGDALVVDEHERRGFLIAQRLHDEGSMLVQIGETLARMQIQPPRRGKRWYASSVRSILRSKMALEKLGDL
jgi:site-specific DNA recombinase